MSAVLNWFKPAYQTCEHYQLQTRDSPKRNIIILFDVSAIYVYIQSLSLCWCTIYNTYSRRRMAFFLFRNLIYCEIRAIWKYIHLALPKSRLKHPNIISLLDNYIYGTHSKLPFCSRTSMTAELCRSLVYFHTQKKKKILHKH